MTEPKIIDQSRLRNVWLGGHIDALQEVIQIIDKIPTTGQVNETLEALRDMVNSKLILAQDILRRLRERS